MKFLILSITTGQGHHQTGKAITSYMEKNGHEIEQLDCYEYFSPAIKEMLSQGYLLSTKYSPKLYGKFYRLAEKMEKKSSNTILLQITNSIFHKKMEAYLEEYNPDAVICTHVFAALLMTYLKEHGTSYPTVGVVTDFKVHPHWEVTKLDYYVLPNEYLIPSMVKKGFKKEQLLPFGIPIYEKFRTKEDKKTAREQLGFDNIPTILMMSGSMGYGNIAKMIKNIDSVDREFQVITVCGNNKKLKKKIDKATYKHKVHNFGFVNTVDKLMDAADCIVTKPGGLTVSEALAKGLPMAIFKPIPGQEERNLEFLLNFGACMKISKTSPVDEVVEQLFMDSRKINAMLGNIELIKKPDSTEKLCEHILSMKKTAKKGEQ